VTVLNWDRARELLAETAREIGVLIVVFAPLEAAFSDVPLNRAFISVLFLVGLLFIAGGIIMGARK